MGARFSVAVSVGPLATDYAALVLAGERWSYEEGEDGPPELSAREREVLARVFPAAPEEDPTFFRRLVSRFASRS
jgi:hypothetical protein